MKALTIVLLLALLALAGPADAELHTLEALIDGGQEVPPSGSPATGFGFVTFDDVTGDLSWDISWSALTGPATAMHFHGPAPAGANAGVQVNVGAISGLTSPSIGSTNIVAGQAADLLSNLWYINIHSAQFPGGEIRGQVFLMVSTPNEPSTWSRVKDLYR